MKDLIMMIVVSLVCWVLSAYSMQSDIERELKEEGTYSLIFSSGIIKGTIIEPTYNLKDK